MSFKIPEPVVFSDINRESFRAMLADARMRNDHRLMERSLLALYALQTDDERVSERTKRNNDRGFSKKTDKKGNYIAKWLLRGNRVSRQYLEHGYDICHEHAGQLARVAAGGRLREIVDGKMSLWNSNLHIALRRHG